jgi:hypothetical protein
MLYGWEILHFEWLCCHISAFVLRNELAQQQTRFCQRLLLCPAFFLRLLPPLTTILIPILSLGYARACLVSSKGLNVTLLFGLVIFDALLTAVHVATASLTFATAPVDAGATLTPTIAAATAPSALAGRGGSVGIGGIVGGEVGDLVSDGGNRVAGVLLSRWFGLEE